MIEQRTHGYEPDLLTLHTPGSNGHHQPTHHPGSSPAVALMEPDLTPTDEAEIAAYRRKQSIVTVRETENDHVVAVIEVVSPGNKSSQNGLRSFLEKAGELLDCGIHLLVIDLHPPTPRDPQGIHAALWDYMIGEPTTDRATQPLTVASYEAVSVLRAYVERLAVGDALPAMPLFLMPRRCVKVPLEATYQAAFAELPRRWAAVLEE
jgi:hypothetical protein